MTGSAPFPERLEGHGVLLRGWRPEDAEPLASAVTASLEHLRPWMPWIAGEPLALEERRAKMAERERDRAAGGDAFYLMVVAGVVAGSAGLHRRVGPHAVELGYWTHVAFVRRGLATAAARLLTAAAFTVADIERVEIHHDEANVASAGVPRRLGYELTARAPRSPAAPAETGTDWVWTMTRDAWATRDRATA